MCRFEIKRWLSTVCPWLLTEMIRVSRSWIVLELLKNIVIALLTCIFALGGAIVGVISGALKGQTTETGILRGVGVGAVAGAITAVQLMELVINGEPFSKVALICSLINGKIFMEWVSPAVLKAYQWQISTMETGLMEISDIFEVNTCSRGLSHDEIKVLTTIFKFRANVNNTVRPRHQDDVSCSICLQEMKDGESMRRFNSCRHYFHLNCIDEWLVRHGTCPICRMDVS